MGGPKIEIKKPVENKRYPRSSSESEIKYFSHEKNTKPGQFDDEKLYMNGLYYIVFFLCKFLNLLFSRLFYLWSGLWYEE